MKDKTFQSGLIFTSQRSRMTTEEWIAPLDREIREMERELKERAELFGLRPLDHPDCASNSRR